MKTRLLFGLAAVMLYLMPNVIFGQAINLGAAANFVLYTTGGSVHDNASSNSHLTGDVGYYTSGDFLGFGNVNGVMHAGVNASTTACELALQSAVTQLNAKTPTLFPGLLLGNGVIFTPGVYSVPGNASLTLNLVLDAQNVDTAEFIIKITGTFSTGAASSVSLINGAKACNVYWLIGGVVTMATNTSMKGSIIVNNAAINVATGSSIEGRLLTTTGAITIDGINAYTPQCTDGPVLTGPTLPDIGSLDCYTIYSSNGALTNTIGTSTVVGDVGNNGIGSITGWDPAAVTGTLHLVQDASTIQAAADLSNLYDTLDAMIPDIELLYPAKFGNDLVLTPHVYVMNSATSFTGSLYLDAQGNADGVFVIKIVAGSPALTTSTYAKVILINGAKAENVFWLIKGATSINNYSEFVGTIVIPSGAIDLINTGVSLEGRAFTMIGAITTAGLTAIMPPGCILGSSPLIITEPLNQTVCAGDTAIFSVSATGDSLYYQWRKGNIDLVDGGNISGATTDTLIIFPVLISDTASNYNVIVSGSIAPNDTSINVTLTVDTIPVITTEPVSHAVCEGSMVNFSVTATGAGLSYQWRKGTVNLIDGGNISGATSDTLTINPVNINDTASNYNVIVSGACLPADTSINVSLTVDTAPAITTEPVSQTECLGNPVSFSVVASGTNITYQWRKGTVNLINGGNISGATSDTLTIDPMLITDTSSFYNVIVSGTCLPNDTSVNVSLMVGIAPMITVEPINDTVCAGSSASFMVTAIGTNLTYQWRKGNVNLINGTNISGANTNTLTIITAGISDAANNYNVVVSGDCAPDATSINAALIVDSATVIISQPSNQIVCLGDSVSFTVVASGKDLTYQWRKGTVDLVDGGNISGATTATLTINPVAFSDTASNYNVVVTGGCSPVSSTTVGLNSSGRFAILAATGISTTGFSVITDMDVGISPGARSSITGFPPATIVNGAIYASDDVAPPGVAAMLIQAKQELTDAYLFAEGASAPAPVTVAGDQGGVTLAPGIYKSTSTLLIQSGDLILDGQGDANAEWIFQIASDFTTIGGAGGSVILTGNAQAKNITWQVGSSATIGNGTSFKGTILAYTSITMNTGSSIDGRLLAINGAVVLSGTNIINSPLTSSVSTSTDTTVYVSLSVTTAPDITTQPVSQTVCSGDSVSFTVVSSGDGLSYQWRKGNTNLINAINIKGANTATLIINPAGISDAASDYNVIVTGVCAPNDTSNFAALIVNEAPVITTQPISQTVCEGNSVSFSVIASGTGLTYQWRKGSADLINIGSVSGVTTATLTINPAGLGDVASNYNVVVSGLCAPNDTSNNVSLAISTAPVITTQPANQTVCVGDPVSFSVISTGAGLNYQWRKGNTNLLNAVNITGVNTATLTINPAGISDAASDYNVIVTGACAPNDTSNFAALIVSEAPVITTQPLSQTACLGNSISFSVSATGAGLTYQWRRGNVNLLNIGSVSGATSATLTINPIILTDAATDYNVIVYGLCAPNDTSNNVSLVISTAPIITTQPANQTVCEGDTVSFSVISTGAGLSYQWRKGNVNLTNAGNISGVNTATLTINPAGITDAASDYNVIVTGACAPADTSIDASLVVDTSPVITIQNSNQSACEGSSVSFSVTATGTGLTYQWRKGLVNLINGGQYSGVTTSVLTINPVSMSDSVSDYNVVVSNTCLPDVISLYASLTVYAVPEITIQPEKQTACTGIVASFTVYATGSGLTYQWRRGTMNLVDGGNISGATTPTLTIYPVNPSDAATDYNVVVSGICSPAVTSENVSLVINTTGIGSDDSGSSANVVSMYPNPFSSTLSLAINEDYQLEKCYLVIFNVLGKVVMNTSITEHLTTLETGHLPSGIYFYRVIDNGIILQSGKLIAK